MPIQEDLHATHMTMPKRKEKGEWSLCKTQAFRLEVLILVRLLPGSSSIPGHFATYICMVSRYVWVILALAP